MLLTSFSRNSMSSLLSPISLITAFPLFFCFVISFPLLGFLSSSFFLWCLLTASAYVIEMLEGFSTSLLSHMLNYISLLSYYTLILPLPHNYHRNTLPHTYCPLFSLYNYLLHVQTVGICKISKGDGYKAESRKLDTLLSHWPADTLL